jgi:ABC-type transport system involved in multi-copper enzyme maturation permease subunit
MTVVADHPAPAAKASAGGSKPGPTLGRLIRAELLKVRTTNLWSILAVCAFVTVGLALLLNCVVAHSEIHNALNTPDFTAGAPPGKGLTPDQIAQLQAQWRAANPLRPILLRNAANIFTSGQYFGLLIVMLFGTLLVTGEYYNQTATTTFLGSPRRTRVIFAKVGTAVIVAAIAWFVTTLIDLGVGAVFFNTEGQPNSLGVWAVQRSILMNLPAYALWALLGMGLGALLRSQIAATLVGAGLYVIGGSIAPVVFVLVYNTWIKQAWVLQAMVALPAQASSVMISPERVQIPFAAVNGAAIYFPPWWVGALILVGYGILATGVGTLLIRRRDIS